MADGVPITPGIGANVHTDEVTLGGATGHVQFVKLIDGTDGATGRIFGDPNGLGVQGGTSHDGVDAGNPVKIGGQANRVSPAAVANADRVNAWFDPFGRLVTLPGHPKPGAPVTLETTASGAQNVVASQGAGTVIYICKGSVHNNSTVAQFVGLMPSSGGTVGWRAKLAADGGGSLFDFGARGLECSSDDPFAAFSSTTGQYQVNVTEWYTATST